VNLADETSADDAGPWAICHHASPPQPERAMELVVDNTVRNRPS
jgi:hypothetical protein